MAAASPTVDSPNAQTSRAATGEARAKVATRVVAAIKPATRGPVKAQVKETRVVAAIKAVTTSVGTRLKVMVPAMVVVVAVVAVAAVVVVAGHKST